MSMNVILDLEACQGYTCCMMEAGSVFDLDEATGKAILLQPTPSAELRVQVESAARACPARAIRIENG
ncbi:ferredoxin [Streptomyces sp. Li-HN-5-11]|uniref:ferredoxin n=1 Tax=Streptomyces sp. Li-HN-5-11 TaxID=3075432 RepID=UPI0028ABA9FB|nr:ferredoxin [Streptomyces sp. Li-HN-5-11]WNM35731.1 ferredoxin [Streptomyces sp. Li-HN-5-11]